MRVTKHARGSIADENGSVGTDPRSVICLVEDRKSCEPAIKLLLLTLKAKCAHVPIVLFYPPADQEFVDWVDSLSFKSISVRARAIPGAYGWNNKPHALLELLNEGNHEAVWIDTDILVTKDITLAFAGLKSDVLVIAEEALLAQNDDDALRARMWGFPVRRAFPFTLNACVMRVTNQHVPLLERWKELLESPTYRSSQQQPMSLRPLHMFSDLDVITALLCSEEFGTIPVKILRRGKDIIQYYEQTGFTVAERVTCMLKGMPIFIHQQGWKPWISGTEGKLKGLRGKFVAAYQDQSPYTVMAISLNPAAIESWMQPRSRLSSILRTIGFGYAPLTGLPTAVIFDLERLAKLPRQIAKKVISVVSPDLLTALRARRATKENGDGQLN